MKVLIMEEEEEEEEEEEDDRLAATASALRTPLGEASDTKRETSWEYASPPSRCTE